MKRWKTLLGKDARTIPEIKYDLAFKTEEKLLREVLTDG